VLSVLRPVDLPPFNDEGLLANAETSHATPKIFYTFSSTEYWARAGSLTHTSDDGQRDVAPAPTSRLYFLAGTPHAFGTLGAARPPGLEHFANFAEQRWVTRALLMDLDAWVRGEAEPPPSQYPLIAKRQLVPLGRVRFPAVPSLSFPTYMPQVWRMDFGPSFSATKVITKDPPQLGAPFRVLVPQTDTDGNDLGGIRLPEIAVPLGTYTGWNVTVPALKDLGYLAGLVGSFDPFALTREQREEHGDERLSIRERYAGRQDYLNRVKKAADDLVRQRLLRPEDLAAVMARAEAMWNAVVGSGP
jgi:Alpha/beta hydrolase domain